jgi:diaminohydroxyphosphoribosylaminopyrimidine deaminase/5-amino-6-(5-phosphoribosylamino)uracil reductase
MSHMKRALALAGKARGITSPNPAVGAVVVRDGVPVGEGFTQPPGQDHAEVVALQQAGRSARDASLYVTLEPCCTYGRTPPCTRAIIAAGIGEVYVATTDPNPRVNGKGLSELEAAGIKVYRGEGEEEAGELYEAFARHVNTGLPFVTAKFAMSLDGKIATHTGDSKWVTGPPARGYVQEMRETCDAIMVGVNTVLLDNPRLTARDGDGRLLPSQPLRVILDSKARTPTDARLLNEPGLNLIAVTQSATDDRTAALREAGAEVLQLPETVEGMVAPCALLQALGARGVVSLLVEGGGALLGSLFDLGMVDKVAAFIAPKIIGGISAPSPVGGNGSVTMSQAIDIERAKVEQIGDDVLIIGYPSARALPIGAISISGTDPEARVG